MTAYEIINTGFGLAGESLDSFPDKDLAVIWLNSTIAECTEAENTIRERNCLPQLDEAGRVISLSEEVDLSHCITHLALPYGVGSYLYSDRGDNYMASIFRNRFITALQNCAKGLEKAVEDVYGGEV